RCSARDVRHRAEATLVLVGIPDVGLARDSLPADHHLDLPAKVETALVLLRVEPAERGGVVVLDEVAVDVRARPGHDVRIAASGGDTLESLETGGPAREALAGDTLEARIVHESAVDEERDAAQILLRAPRADGSGCRVPRDARHVG